ncbi:hypothetical protein ES703_58076 [subsurface metagenome]
MGKKVVTLYIDDSSLRLLVAKGKQVKKWATLPLESRLVRDGVVFHEAKLAAKIKELLKAQRVRTKKVVAGLSGLHCLSRAFTLPQLPESMLAEAVRREAERTLPVPLDQLYLSWQIISTSAKEIQVFLAALPRNATDALIETLRQAGVKPYLMDLAPLALARVVNTATAIIVDVRSTEFDIVIMVDGVPQLIRSLSLPSEARALHEKLTTVREELGRTIDFHNSNQAEKPLEPDLPIFVCGGLAEKPKLCQSLSDELERPVLPLSSPLKCPKGFAPSQYMVNIGLALKELSPGKETNLSVVDLNALPEVYRRKPPRLLQALIVPTIIIMAIGSLFPLVLLVRSSATDIVSLQAQLDTTNQLIEQREAQQQSQKEAIAELENKVVELEEINNAFTTVRKSFNIQRGIVNADLVAATSNLPGTSDFSRISHASVELTISGKSPNEMEVLTYANALRASGRFSQVIVSSIQKTEEGVSFTLTLTARE